MKRILITGGAGFIGTNAAVNFLQNGDHVTLFDNLSRRGSRQNLSFLQKQYPKIQCIEGDIRHEKKVSEAVKRADVIVHLAAQVAVTGSIQNPREDFEVNAGGTFNVLEAMRLGNKKAILIYSSTNKVYGSLEHIPLRETSVRYTCPTRRLGIDENEPLDFHSPYGCSKGAADQYVHDYSRIYGLKTIVFRQSCIYGPHQFGVEDQGWVAWFLIAAILGKSITIYGNGKQVRDLLYVDDLVRAYQLAIQNWKTTNGQVYVLGGGQDNSLSIWKEFGPIVEKLISKKIHVEYTQMRPGDQPYFVGNTKKAFRDFGWKPKIPISKGIPMLYRWLVEHQTELQ